MQSQHFQQTHFMNRSKWKWILPSADKYECWNRITIHIAKRDFSVWRGSFENCFSRCLPGLPCLLRPDLMFFFIYIAYLLKSWHAFSDFLFETFCFSCYSIRRFSGFACISKKNVTSACHSWYWETGTNDCYAKRWGWPLRTSALKEC